MIAAFKPFSFNACRERNIKLNKEKFMFCLSEVSYMRHQLTAEGLKLDPNEVRAIANMIIPTCTDIAGVRSKFGTITYLSQFLPQLSTMCEPLRSLTHQDVEWEWSITEQEAFKQTCQIVSSAPVLKYYDIKQELTIQRDASESGIAAALMQNG